MRSAFFLFAFLIVLLTECFSKNGVEARPNGIRETNTAVKKATSDNIDLKQSITLDTEQEIPSNNKKKCFYKKVSVNSHIERSKRAPQTFGYQGSTQVYNSDSKFEEESHYFGQENFP